MKIKKQLIKREIAGDTILVPVGKTVYDSNGLFVLNELAAFIWDILPEVSDEVQIVERILADYEVTREVASADTAQFLRKLREMGIID
ncbi:MAG: PqqD family protein [Lachnospiraceae bacterium]|nr:PqqD family protein [Lachnospiraceae bacterium]MBQ8813368.1 PqqD family protein [Lachnospiraceae bacterium]